MVAVGSGLTVREMRPEEVGIRMDYFHNASDSYLHMLGVDRSLLPSREEWRAGYEADFARPIEERDTYALVWELDGVTVGFSSTDRIAFGQEAFMHLHILDPDQRRLGIGSQFVALSADHYMRRLQLRVLFSEPNAFNVASNRTLQRAGFKYLFTHETTPSSINFPQVATRWCLEAWKA